MSSRLSKSSGVWVLAVALVLCLSACPGNKSVNIVSFADPGLEGAVRAALGHPQGLLTEFDLLALKDLDASNLGIRSLEGLEHALHLKHLDLSGNDVADLSPLDGLYQLSSLVVDDQAQ